jgi:hypothetical protein
VEFQIVDIYFISIGVLAIDVHKTDPGVKKMVDASRNTVSWNTSSKSVVRPEHTD